MKICLPVSTRHKNLKTALQYIQFVLKISFQKRYVIGLKIVLDFFRQKIFSIKTPSVVPRLQNVARLECGGKWEYDDGNSLKR